MNISLLAKWDQGFLSNDLTSEEGRYNLHIIKRLDFLYVGRKPLRRFSNIWRDTIGVLPAFWNGTNFQIVNNQGTLFWKHRSICVNRFATHHYKLSSPPCTNTTARKWHSRRHSTQGQGPRGSSYQPTPHLRYEHNSINYHLYWLWLH